mmetsp:Transcript_3302/g.5129  ORF Transcript_3302/g.5129 Transcript_3302/m.5129 type:complete len:138 (+) Transcript_3302:789-1202(+)
MICPISLYWMSRHLVWIPMQRSWLSLWQSSSAIRAKLCCYRSISLVIGSLERSTTLFCCHMGRLYIQVDIMSLKSSLEALDMEYHLICARLNDTLRYTTFRDIHDNSYDNNHVDDKLDNMSADSRYISNKKPSSLCS